MTHLIGLTGQSGAGKSLAAKTFKDSGFAIIDADKCARKAVEPGSECLSEIAEVFGEGILNSDKTLDRKKLAAIVFDKKAELKKLNAIMHPYILEIVCSEIKNLQESGFELILLDAPTLFESKADDICDLIISVTAKEEIRLKRIAERDKISEENIMKRFKSGHSENFFIKHSDFVIKNNKSPDELIKKAEEVAENNKKYYTKDTRGKTHG
jgi:dephospho-CoA kinase